MCENMLVSCVEYKRNEGISWLWDSMGTNKTKTKITKGFGFEPFGLVLFVGPAENKKKIVKDPFGL